MSLSTMDKFDEHSQTIKTTDNTELYPPKINWEIVIHF